MACTQVSEDHCWLTLAEDGSREASVEVTTDTTAKRGLAADAAAWDGWLYNGGHATVCSPQVACFLKAQAAGSAHYTLLQPPTPQAVA